MKFEIDPAADALWGSVSTIQTAAGVEEHFPKTDEEWLVARGNAIRLMEAGNLLLIGGRHVAMDGDNVALDDQGTAGNLSAAQSEKMIQSNRGSFNAFAVAMRAVGYQMLKAIEKRDPAGLMGAGASLDGVCEGCHLKFWYPGQRIPRFPNEAPEIDAPN